MTRSRPSALAVVLGTIALAVGMLATPGATTSGSPVAAVDFIDAWTNDDGTVDGADLGDTGFPSPGYDAWAFSSGDPFGALLDPPRWDKDVAICTAEVRSGDPDFVDVTIDNAYPGYSCTFTTLLENGAAVPIEITPAVIDADPELLVDTIPPQFPDVLGGGQQAPAVFSVTVLQQAPQGATLRFTITIRVATAPSGAISFIRVWDAEPPGDVVAATPGAFKIDEDGYQLGGDQYSVEPPDARLGVPLVIDLGDGRTIAITDWVINEEGEFVAFYYEVEGDGVWLDVKVGPEIHRTFVSGSGLWPI